MDENQVLPIALSEMIESSTVALTLADFTAADCPLIAVNEAFCRLSGYSREEILGRNCRFLQPESGAGPVRARMRSFLTDPTISDARFLIPNVRKDGEPLLNLVYMTKLTRNGTVTMILGSQFEAGRANPRKADLYDLALANDLRQLNTLMNSHNILALGNFDALASSHAIIAEAKLM